MTVIAKIDDEEITAFDFVKILKFNGKFNDLFEDIMLDKLTAHAAKKRGIQVTLEEVQERVDELRRIRGLHRAKDTLKYLESLGISVDEFERYITDALYKEKMFEAVCTDAAVEEYFRLHSPKFESVEVGHIVLNSEDIAREILAYLEDDPEGFSALAEQHSLDQETRERGGLIGKVLRGRLPPAVEAIVFNAPAGAVVGPFETEDGLMFDIFKIVAKHPAKLDDWTKQKIQKILYEDWLSTIAQEHRMEVL